MFESVLDPIFSPLLQLNPFFAIFLISFIITLAITLVYKYTTDQERMRHLRKKTKDYQEKMKKARSDPEKMMKLQQEAMSFNLELMKHSFKPTLYTMIPIILIFGWLNGHMAFYQISPGEQFDITATFSPDIAGNATIDIIGDGVEVISEPVQSIEENTATWQLQGREGNYKAAITTGTATQEKKFLISTEREYEPPEAEYNGAIQSITLSNEKVKPLEPFSLFGWRPGWLGTYILLSIAMSIGLRKLLNVV